MMNQPDLLFLQLSLFHLPQPVQVHLLSHDVVALESVDTGTTPLGVRISSGLPLIATG